MENAVGLQKQESNDMVGFLKYDRKIMGFYFVKAENKTFKGFEGKFNLRSFSSYF
jgi:hypothetical protein